MELNSNSLKLYLACRLTRTYRGIGKIRTLSVEISSLMCNVSQYSEESCLRDSRFMKFERPMICHLIKWQGNSKRNSSKHDPFLGTSILLRRLVNLHRWAKLETAFDLLASKLSKIFFEIVWALLDKCEAASLHIPKRHNRKTSNDVR